MAPLSTLCETRLPLGFGGRRDVRAIRELSITRSMLRSLWLFAR